ncbi:hypothetical protein EGM51_02920 [Verrucomicrobia bacterium S94]|nr:hypothetical protein EGM51_02920 [Verrucomicrobia bacterium S94]
MVRKLLVVLIAVFLAVVWVRASDITVLTEEPVAEFALPDGSVLKNAFVWRRSSEGLMIVHDGGQYFLNFKLLPDDWKAAYLGEPKSSVSGETEAQLPDYVLNDPHGLQQILERVPELTPVGLRFVLREGADEASAGTAFGMAILQSLLDEKFDTARRLMLISEELGQEIEGVGRDDVAKTCPVCNGEGRVFLECKACGGSGKCARCGGEGERETGIGNHTVRCTACRGTGDCPVCGGAGGKTVVCRACGGRGRILKTKYCEVRLNRLVQTANRMADPDWTQTVVQADRAHVLKTLERIPGLEYGAARFYASDAYNGAMDTNIVLACAVHSILNKELEEAERFHLIIQANYGGDEIFELKNYLNICSVCDGKGYLVHDCSVCNGSGKCPRCGGDGLCESLFDDRTYPCTACRENKGKCRACGGTGEKRVRCSACGGSGRTIDEERCRIRRELLIRELNGYYREHMQQ